jgi:hypothetical protein
LATFHSAADAAYAVHAANLYPELVAALKDYVETDGREDEIKTQAIVALAKAGEWQS